MRESQFRGKATRNKILPFLLCTALTTIVLTGYKAVWQSSVIKSHMDSHFASGKEGIAEGTTFRFWRQEGIRAWLGRAHKLKGGFGCLFGFPRLSRPALWWREDRRPILWGTLAP